MTGSSNGSFNGASPRLTIAQIQKLAYQTQVRIPGSREYADRVYLAKPPVALNFVDDVSEARAARQAAAAAGWRHLAVRRLEFARYQVLDDSQPAPPPVVEDEDSTSIVTRMFAGSPPVKLSYERGGIIDLSSCTWDDPTEAAAANDLSTRLRALCGSLELTPSGASPQTDERHWRSLRQVPSADIERQIKLVERGHPWSFPRSGPGTIHERVDALFLSAQARHRAGRMAAA